MKKKRILIFMLMLVLISGCTGKKEQESSYDISGKTYFNTVDDYGNEDHSKIWFGKDGSFVMKDNFYDGYYELNGNWSISENVITLEVKESGIGNYSKLIFEVKDADTLILKTTLAGSKSDDIFSTTETKGSNVPSGSSTKLDYDTFYNISQTSNNKSYVEIRSDGSFAFIDQNDFGIEEINGTYEISNDDLILRNFQNYSGSLDSIRFIITDKETIVLQTEGLGVSKKGDVFYTGYESSSSSSSSDEKIPCTGLSSLYNNYWATEGVKNYNLEAKPTPANTTDKIAYYSEDDKIASVDAEGNVTAVAVGNTKIHITCGTIERIVGFEVRAKGPSSVELEEKKLSVYLNNTIQIKAKALPATADQTLTYESSDSSIASVDSKGLVTGVAPGNVKITVKAKNGVSATCDVCVEGEDVIFEFPSNASVKEASGEKVAYKGYWISCYDGVVNKQDVTLELSFQTAFTSAIDIDGNGNIYAKGYVYQTFDCPFKLSFSDGSSFYKEKEFTIHIVKP